MKYNQVIIIPAYQPSLALLSLVDELKANFNKIVIVDDGGKKPYKEIFRELQEKDCIVLTHEVNMGKGRAMKTAFNYCLSLGDEARSGVITVDADGQHKVKDITKIAEVMNTEGDVVVLGCRDFSTGNVPFKSLWGNNISRRVYKILCGIDVSDTQTGLRGLPFSFLIGACVCPGERYEYETNMLIDIKEKGYPIVEVSIETVYENSNESSHFNPIKDSIRIYSVIFKYSFSSILSAIIDYCVFIILLFCGLPIIASTYIARATSCLINFSINKKLVFNVRKQKTQSNTKTQFVKYIALVVLSSTISGLSVTWLTSLLTGFSPVLIKIPVEVILYVFNFAIQRLLIFKGGVGYVFQCKTYKII